MTSEFTLTTAVTDRKRNLADQVQSPHSEPLSLQSAFIHDRDIHACAYYVETSDDAKFLKLEWPSHSSK